MADFEFLSADDKPALTAIQNDELRAKVDSTLQEMGYVVHNVESHEKFPAQFAQASYEVMVMEDGFGGGTLADNKTLESVQLMQMNLRRHCTFMLIGAAFETLNPMQGFGQSVHAVVNPAEIENIKPLMQKVIADNETFLHTFFDVQQKLNDS
jgi:hypothetical protein